MSYNIDSVTLISSARPLTMTREAVEKWRSRQDGDVPETFENTMSAAWAIAVLADRPIDEAVDITKTFTWSGEWSGPTYNDGTLAEFAADTAGDASYLLTWEGGDSLTGLRIVDGKAYVHKLVTVLGEQVEELAPS